MTIHTEQKCLVLRVNNFQNYSFVEEHKRTIEQTGYVWMVKLGKMLSDKSLEEIIECGGHLILKTPKKQNEAYYYAHLVEFMNGTSPKEAVFPDYYAEIAQQEGMTEITGTWLKVDCIYPIENEKVEHFVLASNGKKLTDIVGVTRTSYLFVVSNCNLTLSYSHDGLGGNNE